MTRYIFAFSELMKKVASRWDSLDDNAKSKYIVAYKNDMESYGGILQKYQKSLSPEQKELQEQFKLDKQIRKERREKKKRLRETGKPKRPSSGFLLFMKSQVAEGASLADRQAAAKDLAVKWKAMSETEKAPFNAKYKEDLQKYEHQLAKWEEKMIKQVE
jgi:hypothetical protein